MQWRVSDYYRSRNATPRDYIAAALLDAIFTTLY